MLRHRTDHPSTSGYSLCVCVRRGHFLPALLPRLLTTQQLTYRLSELTRSQITFAMATSGAPSNSHQTPHNQPKNSHVDKAHLFRQQVFSRSPFRVHHLEWFASWIMLQTARPTVMGDNPPSERFRNTGVPALNGSTLGFVNVCDFMLREFSFLPRMLTVR